MSEVTNASLNTLGDCVEYAEQIFVEANLYFGHGSFDAFDEAVYLVLWRAAPYSATADLPISRHPLISQYWPEAPASDETIILVGREAIVANNRQPRKA